MVVALFSLLGLGQTESPPRPRIITLIEHTPGMTAEKIQEMKAHRSDNFDAYAERASFDARFFKINIAHRCSAYGSTPTIPSKYRILTHKQVREAWGGEDWGCNHACAYGASKLPGVHGDWPTDECSGYTERIYTKVADKSHEVDGVCEFYFESLAIYRGAPFDDARLPSSDDLTTCYLRGVDCGAHTAARCKYCPERSAQGYTVDPEWECNGDCMFKYEKVNEETRTMKPMCTKKSEADANLVNCGGHSAHSCMECVTRFTFSTAPADRRRYCNGDCDYESGDCGAPVSGTSERQLMQNYSAGNVAEDSDVSLVGAPQNYDVSLVGAAQNVSGFEQRGGSIRPFARRSAGKRLRRRQRRSAGKHLVGRPENVSADNDAEDFSMV